MPNPRTFYKHRTQSSKLFAPTSNIRFDSPLVALSRPFGLNTGFGSPYFALSGSIRALDALSRPFGLNTGFWAPYFALSGSIRALDALLPAAIRAFGRLLARGQYAAPSSPGLHFVHPGLYSGAPSGRSHGVHFVYPNLGVALRLPCPRGCTSFTPGCILAPLQGARS